MPALIAGAATSARAAPPAPVALAAPAPPPAAPAPPAAAQVAVDGEGISLKTDAGDVLVVPVYHGTARLQIDGKTIWLDPWSKADLEGAPPADVVLLTDLHPDHLDPAALAKVVQEGTVFVTPAAVAETLEDREVEHVLANGESVTLGAVKITATPMYNNTRGPEEGVLFHEKGRGNGYLLEYGGRTVYFAGDTACTEDMKALTGVDLAFIPMNLPYTMPPEEAAGCVNAFKPGVVVPYHYAGSDLAVFEAGVTEGSVEVVRAEFYPGGLPW